MCTADHLSFYVVWLLNTGTTSQTDVQRTAELAAELVLERLLKRARSEDDGGITSGTVLVSVQGADEVQLWDEHVKGKVRLMPVHIRMIMMMIILIIMVITITIIYN